MAGNTDSIIKSEEWSMCERFILLLGLVLLSGAANAEKYRCQDAQGYWVYSGKPCDNDAAEEEAISEGSNSDSGAGQPSPRKGNYTKDIPSLQAPDVPTKACFDYMNTTDRFPDPSTTRLLASERKWVTVKDVGGRQMVTIRVTSKNEAGMYVGAESFDCLLMGDNATINTRQYELVSDD